MRKLGTRETQHQDFYNVLYRVLFKCAQISLKIYACVHASVTFFSALRSPQGEVYSKQEYLSFQFSSVTQSCPTVCDPMTRSTPGFPVHHQLPEFTQTHVHRVGDAIQPSHPLSSPSLPAPNPSQHQGLIQQVNSSHEVAKVLEFQLQYQSFQ